MTIRKVLILALVASAISIEAVDVVDNVTNEYLKNLEQSKKQDTEQLQADKEQKAPKENKIMVKLSKTLTNLHILRRTNIEFTEINGFYEAFFFDKEEQEAFCNQFKNCEVSYDKD